MFWGNDSNSIGSPKVGFPFTASHPTHLTFKVAATGELPDIPSPSQIGLGALLHMLHFYVGCTRLTCKLA